MFDEFVLAGAEMANSQRETEKKALAEAARLSAEHDTLKRKHDEVEKEKEQLKRQCLGLQERLDKIGPSQLAPTTPAPALAAPAAEKTTAAAVAATSHIGMTPNDFARKLFQTAPGPVTYKAPMRGSEEAWNNGIDSVGRRMEMSEKERAEIYKRIESDVRYRAAV